MRTRKACNVILLLLVWVGSFALSSFAQAANLSGFYAGAAVGAVSLPEGFVKNTLAPTSTYSFKNKLGYHAETNVGYTFQHLRFEAALDYNNNKVKWVKNNTGDLSQPGGHIQSAAVFGNAYYDFDLGNGYFPYLGIGLGAERVQTEVKTVAGYRVSGAETSPAYQGIMGLGMQVDPRWMATIDYRYVGSSQHKDYLWNNTTQTASYRFQGNLLSVGIRYLFAD